MVDMFWQCILDLPRQEGKGVHLSNVGTTESNRPLAGIWRQSADLGVTAASFDATPVSVWQRAWYGVAEARYHLSWTGSRRGSLGRALPDEQQMADHEAPEITVGLPVST
jgi:hypothetical protein